MCEEWSPFFVVAEHSPTGRVDPTGHPPGQGIRTELPNLDCYDVHVSAPRRHPFLFFLFFTSLGPTVVRR
jgi:hypothetical protein